jgi:hypothetical protein
MRCASSRKIPSVWSLDWSFTAMISEISGCAANDSMQPEITASSSRAGTIALMDADSVMAMGLGSVSSPVRIG